MKATVDPTTCIGCGMCIDICPEIFKYNDKSQSESALDEIPEDLVDKADEAVQICPVEAITLE